MASKNTTLNLPEALIARTRAYAAAHGTTMTAIVRSHLEAITAEPEQAPDDPLHAYAQGLIRRDEAIDHLGVRDYADLLVTPSWATRISLLRVPPSTRSITKPLHSRASGHRHEALRSGDSRCRAFEQPLGC